MKLRVDGTSSKSPEEILPRGFRSSQARLGLFRIGGDVGVDFDISHDQASLDGFLLQEGILHPEAQGTNCCFGFQLRVVLDLLGLLGPLLLGAAQEVKCCLDLGLGYGFASYVEVLFGHLDLLGRRSLLGVGHHPDLTGGMLLGQLGTGEDDLHHILDVAELVQDEALELGVALDLKLFEFQLGLLHSEPLGLDSCWFG